MHRARYSRLPRCVQDVAGTFEIGMVLASREGSMSGIGCGVDQPFAPIHRCFETGTIEYVASYRFSSQLSDYRGCSVTAYQPTNTMPISDETSNQVSTDVTTAASNENEFFSIYCHSVLPFQQPSFALKH
jgi:hypothetical protein